MRSNAVNALKIKPVLEQMRKVFGSAVDAEGLLWMLKDATASVSR